MNRISLLLISLIVSSMTLEAQIGEITSSEGTTRRKNMTADWMLIETEEGVELQDQLSTDLPDSKLGVLLFVGPHFVLGPGVEVEVSQRSVTPLEIELVLQKGALRVITGASDIPIVTRKPGLGRARANGTGYMVICGQPHASTPDACLFIGVYSQTEVSSEAPGTSSVLLDPQFFTEVRPDEGPDRPRRMEDLQFRQLLDLTSIVGTGSESDRIPLAGLADPPAIPRGPRRPPTEPPGDPAIKVPVDPEPPPRLPDPPDPPNLEMR